MAGSWAVRETFVAVITTNLPMLWKFLRVVVSPLLGSFASRSRSLSGFWRSNNKKGGGGGGGGRTPEPGSFQLQDTTGSQHGGGGGGDKMSKNAGRRGPKTLYPVTVLSESEERIMHAEQQQQMMMEGSGGIARGDSNSSQGRHDVGGGAYTPGIEVKRDIEISIEETTERYQHYRGPDFGTRGAEAYMHPTTNTTAGAYVSRRL